MGTLFSMQSVCVWCFFGASYSTAGLYTSTCIRTWHCMYVPIIPQSGRSLGVTVHKQHPTKTACTTRTQTHKEKLSAGHGSLTMHKSMQVLVCPHHVPVRLHERPHVQAVVSACSDVWRDGRLVSWIEVVAHPRHCCVCKPGKQRAVQQADVSQTTCSSCCSTRYTSQPHMGCTQKTSGGQHSWQQPTNSMSPMLQPATNKHPPVHVLC